MPFTSPKRNVSDAENKLRLLYCVHALEQVGEAQLWPFVASLDLMDYIPMQLLMHELLSGGELHMGVEALSGMITLSPHGQETLRLFAHRVMASDREMIDKAAPAYRSQLQKRRHVRAAYESAQAGDYRTLLSISEGELPLLSIRLHTSSRAFASRSIRAFEPAAASILAFLYGLDYAAEVPCSLQEFHSQSQSMPILTSHSPHEHTVTAEFVTDAARFELSLLLPSLEAAAGFRRRLCDEVQQSVVAERLFVLLCAE